jgi:hypothetical protein
MKDHDREEALGRLLASMQREAAAAPGGAERENGRAPRSAQREGGCLDAESLAAWVDNQLTPAQRSAAETHAASCLHCQAMLAAMARTASAADMLATEEAPSRSWVFRFAPWMAGLGGAVAVVLLIVAMQPRIPESTGVPAAESPDTKVARVEAPKEAAPADQFRAMTDDSSAAAGNATSSRSRADARGVRPAPAKDSDARLKAAAETLAKQEKAAQPAARDEPEVRSADAAAAAPKPAAPVPPLVQGQAPVVPPQVTQGGERAQEFRRVGGAGQQAARQSSLAETVVVTSAGPLFIQSPDPKVRWRIMGGTIVQRSADAGATWTTQDAKVELPLAAGSAPTSNVCWVVGRAGTVLVTTDGQTWRRVTAPAPVDLLSVVATSADYATVTAADGRSFTTSDQGRTWR